MVLRAQLFACLLNCQLCRFLLFETNPGTTTLREVSCLQVGGCTPLFHLCTCQGHPKAHPSARIWHMPKSVSLWSALPGATPATHPACFFLGFSQPPRPTKTIQQEGRIWKCACELGILPAGILKTFGNAEAMMRLGVGQCYHKK